MNLLFDTNILLSLAKDTRAKQTIKIINPDDEKIFASVATIGELKSIVLQNNWGANKLQSLNEILAEIIITEINENLVSTYVEIDAYSQRRNPRYFNYPFQPHEIWVKMTYGSPRPLH